MVDSGGWRIPVRFHADYHRPLPQPGNNIIIMFNLNFLCNFFLPVLLTVVAKSLH